MDNNYDERFQEVETQKEEALSELEKTYAGMIDDSKSYYQDQIDAAKDWANQQQQLQQERTDFAIEQIEQQKEQTTKDYHKEQSGAYVDWKKQSNQYGTVAEQQAAQGVADSGYSESSQVSMYNTYQNRVAVAREIYNLAIQNYDNDIKEARIQNNSAMAAIAYNSLQTQLELALQGFQYENQLVTMLEDKKMETEQIYYSRYLDVLDQINAEIAQAEEQRQYDAEYAWREQQAAEDKRQYDAEWAWKMEQAAEEQRRYEAEQAWKEAQAAEEKRQFDENQELKKKQLEEEQRQFDIKNAQTQDKNAEQPTIEALPELPVEEQSGNKSGGGVSSGGKTHSGGYRSFGGSDSTVTTYFNTYESAAAYLRASGVTKDDGGLMTKTEWARGKAGGSGAEAQYSTYTDYLNAYVDWKRSYSD